MMQAESTNTLSDFRAGRLATYSIAAGALGVGASHTNAEVVDFIVDEGIDVGSGFFQDIDANLDGFADIRVKNYLLSGVQYIGVTVSYFPGQVVGFQPGLAYASNLAPGTLIDSSNIGPTFFGSLAYGAYNPNAQFLDVEDGFLGFSFPANGNTYYAFLQIDTDSSTNSLFIEDGAFESVPGVGIEADAEAVRFIPEPTSLAMLAAGAAGLLGYRGRRGGTARD